MKCLIAKIKTGERAPTYKKMISNEEIYTLPNNLNEAIEYTTSALHEENDWYKLSSFSNSPHCINLLRTSFSSVDYQKLSRKEFDSIDYLCSVQDDVFYFQNVSKANLKPHRSIKLGDDYIYEIDSKSINVNMYADAIYVTKNDTLYFQSLSKLTNIFKNISDLYREATADETRQFLEMPFVKLINDYSSDKVKTANRKRIAMALDTLKNYKKKDQKAIFKYISRYCKDLNIDTTNDTFCIGSENDLKLLIYGIEQRYYTTEIGNQRRLANSVILIG